MSIPLETLLARISSDTEDRVKRAKDRFNQLTRSAIRSASGLTLRQRAADLGDEPGSVPVRLVPGLPASLQGRSLSEDHWFSAILALWRGHLEDLRDSSREIQGRLVPQLVNDVRGIVLLDQRQIHLPPTFELAEDLLRELQKFDLVEWLLEVEDDVLGAYIYGDRGTLLYNDENSRIELYWGIIGLIAAARRVDPEDLTVVVLAHELAHAYSHRGHDKDGHRWDVQSFAKSDKAVKEGIAQYYTHLVCEVMQQRCPGAFATYNALLTRQPSIYRTHIPWVQRYEPEQVRLALVGARKAGPATAADFQRRLERGKQLLSKAEKSSVETTPVSEEQRNLAGPFEE
jgi:hypothetical protein